MTSASAAPAVTGTSRLAATPWARKAAHMSGSHPTVSALLSWLAAQVAACVRTAPAAPRAQAGGTACGRDAEAVRYVRGRALRRSPLCSHGRLR